MGKTHLTRHELVKQDEFLVTVTGTWEYLQVHAREILLGIGTVAVVVVAVFGITWFMRNRQQVSNEDISNAIQLYNSPLITDKQRAPLGPNQRIFATAQEKYTKAEQEFARLSRKYNGQVIGETAAYYDAMCKYQLGDSTTAVQQLEALTKTSENVEIGALAKFALAQIYAAQKNTAQVAGLLQQLIDHPTVAVPKITSMMALAEYYKTINNKDAAIQLYKKIQTEFPSFQIQSDVRSRLQELSPGS
ncbi:MAG: tetratricopeptide repeat protein [Acidobacteriia bacterium]|nr:tetratricopeptide repeat protein [Terriglobia bacterium]